MNNIDTKLEKSLETIVVNYLTHNINNLSNMCQNFDTILASLERYLAHQYCAINHDQHWHEFCLTYLRNNHARLVQNGWSNDLHKGCDDRFDSEKNSVKY